MARMFPDREHMDTRELPTRHLIRAALDVASVLDPRGSALADIHESYWRHATGGTLPPADLRSGERLLIACGLVEERGGILHPRPELLDLLSGTTDDAIAHIAYCALAVGTTAGEMHPASSDPQLIELVPDPGRREELLLLLKRRFDDIRRREVGAIGEELVVASVRDELNELGRPDLAREVRHVSLQSDQLGYDISAPRVNGPPRLLEVKATTSPTSDNQVVVYLTRNEIEVGLRYPEQWVLVVCHVTNVGDRRGDVRGWSRATALATMLPTDSHSARWETAAVRVSPELLEPGLPRPSM
jgi:hypothetical protein